MLLLPSAGGQLHTTGTSGSGVCHPAHPKSKRYSAVLPRAGNKYQPKQRTEKKMLDSSISILHILFSKSHFSHFGVMSVRNHEMIGVKIISPKMTPIPHATKHTRFTIDCYTTRTPKRIAIKTINHWNTYLVGLRHGPLLDFLVLSTLVLVQRKGVNRLRFLLARTYLKICCSSRPAAECCTVTRGVVSCVRPKTQNQARPIDRSCLMSSNRTRYPVESC